MCPLKIDQIKRLQLELTTFCNAKCPSCERAKYNVLPEFIYKKQLNSIEVSLEQIKNGFLLINEIINAYSSLRQHR